MQPNKLSPYQTVKTPSLNCKGQSAATDYK